MSKILISVIVPVYNVEEYISKCIQSLIEQTHKDFEVLIIDDGSPDNSVSVAKNIIKNDPRFKFFHKENGGLSDARNFGITKSTGEYVAFLDSDDYYHETFLEKMFLKISQEQSDIVICDVELVNEKLQRIRFQKNIHKIAIPGEDALLDTSILNMAQNKLFRKKLFDDVQYPIGYYYEDRATTYRLFYKSSKISFVNESLFFYLQRENSITRGLNNQKLQDPLKILGEIKAFLLQKGIYDKYQHKYIQNYLLAILSSSVQIANYSDDYEKDIGNYLHSSNYLNFNIKELFFLKNNSIKLLALILLKVNKKLFRILAIKEKKI